MTRREELVAAEKLEDMTFGAWMHMLKYEFEKSGNMKKREVNAMIGKPNTALHLAYDNGYFPEDVAIDIMSYWE